MSGEVIYTPDKGDDWDNAWEMSEYGRKGQLALSLSDYDGASVPVVVSGSWAEVAGSVYKWTANNAISGSATAATAITYIKLVPSGATSAAIVTPTWTATAPVWSDSYQGYYQGTHRFVAGCFFGEPGGNDYSLKWIYYKRDSGPTTKYTKMPNTAVTGVGLGVTVVNGSILYDATADLCICDISFNDNSIITEIGAETDAAAGDVIALQLRRITMTNNLVATMVSMNVTAAIPDPSTVTITNALINNQLYRYMVYGNCTDVSGDISQQAIWFKYTCINRWNA